MTDEKAVEVGVKTEEKTVEPKVDTEIDMSKLAELRAKAKKEKVPAVIVNKKKKSIKFGVVGVGQAGSNLSSSFAKLGYPAVCINTALQDLEAIELPNSCKLHLEYGLGGASRTRAIGHQAAETHKDAIRELIDTQLGGEQVLILCSSLGGGSGSGSLPVMIEVLAGLGKPVIAMVVLPMASEDAQIKMNALETLAELTQEVQKGRLTNLIVVDNAKIESLYSDAGQFEFFKISNEVIVRPLDAFNTYSSMSSAVKALDPSEFAKVILDSGGLTVYGEISITDYATDETAIASAIMENLDSGLLASGFDLKQTKFVGFILAANQKVWSQTKAAAINYASAILADQTGVPSGVFKGVYTSEDIVDNTMKCFFIFSGLGIPLNRIDCLKKETAELSNKTKNKDEARNLNLNLDTGKNATVSEVDKVKEKIALKKSAFGSLMQGTVQDRRKK